MIERRVLSQAAVARNWASPMAESHNAPGLESLGTTSLRSSKNPAAVDAGLPERIGPVRSIAHQSPGFREDTIDVDRRHTVSHRQHRTLDAALDEQISWSDYQGARLLLHDTGEGRLNVAAGTGVEDIDLQPKSRRRLCTRWLCWLDLQARV